MIGRCYPKQKTLRVAAPLVLVGSVGAFLLGPTAPTRTPTAPTRTPASSESQGGQVFISCHNRPSDARRINRAIAASSPGSQIVFQGQCLINQVIELLGNRSYRGEGPGTTLTQANGANLPAILASHGWLDNSDVTSNPVEVSQLQIDGNSANNTAMTDGIILRSWRSTLSDLYVTNMSQDGIVITNLSQNGTTLDSTEVNGRILDNWVSGTGRYGVYVQDTQNAVTDWQLMNNYISNTASDAIHMDNASGWMVERNHVYSVGGDDIYANRVWGTTISDNYLEDFGHTTTRLASGAGTWYGIDVTANGNGPLTIIDDNRVSDFSLVDSKKANTDPGVDPNSTYRFIAISNVNYGDAAVAVEGNALFGTGATNETGLYFSKGSGSELSVTSIGNVVDDLHTQRVSGAGVQLSSGI
jgi:hypothetical protein